MWALIDRFLVVPPDNLLVRIYLQEKEDITSEKTVRKVVQPGHLPESNRHSDRQFQV